MPTPNKIIGKIICTPEECLPGESVLIEVYAPDGTRYENRQEEHITINGVTGSQQYLQFDRPGTQAIFVTAVDGNTVERASAEISVRPLPKLAAEETGVANNLGVPVRSVRMLKAPAIPMLHVARSTYSPYTVGFSVGSVNLFPQGLIDSRSAKPSKTPGIWDIVHPVDLTAASVASLAVAPRPINRFQRLTAITGLRTAGTALPSVSTRELISPGLQNFALPSGKLLQIDAAAIKLDSPPGKPLAFAKMESLQPLSRTPLNIPPVGSGAILYHWDFGDGNKLSTEEPLVQHDFEDSLAPDEEHRQFHITLRIQKPGEEVVEVKRTLSVYNAYAICKLHGVIVPKVLSATFAKKAMFTLDGTLTVVNREEYPLTLTARRIIPLLEDSNVLTEPSSIESLQTPIVVGAKQSTQITANVAFASLPESAVGFTAIYFGEAPNGLPVRVETVFELTARDRRSKAVTMNNIAVGKFASVKEMLTKQLTEISGVRANPSPAAPPRFQMLGHIGRIDVTRFTQTRELLLTQVQTDKPATIIPLGKDMHSAVLYSMRVPPPPVEGEECDPDNIPDDLPEEMVCQATTEKREVISPGRFMNARKGDIILSPGGNGLIGGLLRQVSPPQRYSHSGMMTRNHDQITHSTASEDRLLAYPVGSIAGKSAPSDGHRPDVLKYMWPGVVTQSVEEAIYGEPYLDPETAPLSPSDQKWYSISSFSPLRTGMDINGVWEIVPPLVVKPDPLLETTEIRKKLHEIANDALSQTGNSHYRFYCYTDPTIGQTTVAPADAGWAAGTYPSVCSSFIWMTLKRHGVPLEGPGSIVVDTDLEAVDKSAGAQVGPTTKDGLYLYSAEERLAAGDWLYHALYDLVDKRLSEDAGLLSGPANWFSDMKDDVANQVVNTFASDWAATESKDSDAWKQIQESSAVSPDNILLWDSPKVNSLYGYAAPLVYRPPRLETVTIARWKKVITKGKMSGRVWYNGAPVSGAMVQLYDGMTAFTNPGGYYELVNIPFGPYVAKASKDNPDGTYLSANVDVTIESPDRSLDIQLAPPADVYRSVRITGKLHTLDSETFGSDEAADMNFYRELLIQPWHSHEEAMVVQKMGGEIRIELRFVVDLNMDRSISVRINAKMYEGTSEDTSDLDSDYNLPVFTVYKDNGGTGWIHLVNQDEGGDWSRIDFSVANTTQQN